MSMAGDSSMKKGNGSCRFNYRAVLDSKKEKGS